MKLENKLMSINNCSKLLTCISVEKSEFNNILLWNGSSLIEKVHELFPKANILDVEFDADDYSKVLDFYVNFNNKQSNIKLKVEFAPVDQSITGEFSINDYLLAPAKSPYTFDLIVINGEFEPDSYRIAKNYIDDNSIILIISEDFIPIEKDEFCSESITFKSNNDSIEIKYSLISKNKNIISNLINDINLYYLSKDKSKQDNLIELFERPKLSVVFIQKYNDYFLKDLYKDVFLGSLKYSEQIAYILSTQHLYSDYFSAKFLNHGCKVENIIYNCEELHYAWLIENGYTDASENKFENQIKDFSPDVIFLIEPNNFSIEEITEISKYAGILSVYINNLSKNTLPDSILNKIDVIFTSDESDSVKLINHNHIIKLPNLFDSRCNSSPKDFDLRDPIVQVFCSENEKELINFAKNNLECKINISDFKQIENSQLANEINENVFSQYLFSLISDSKIIITSSIENLNSINPEITIENILGCGVLLITEKLIDKAEFNNKNLIKGKDYFCYNSLEEAILLAKYFLENSNDAEVIAENGKKKILNNNLYDYYAGSIIKELEKIYIQNEK